MAADSRLIPLSLKTNQAFLSDLQALAGESFDVLGALGKATSPPAPTVSATIVSEIAERFNRQPEKLLRVSLTLDYLRSRALEKEVSPAEVIAEIREALPEGVDFSASDSDLRSLFAFTPDVRREALALRAMAGVAPYLESSVTPCLLPASADDDQLVGGFLLSMSFMNSAEEPRSATMTLTPTELTKLKDQLLAAERQLERIGRTFEQTAGTA